MLFTSMEFLFIFLPIVLIVNVILPPKIRNYWLLAASLFFYGWGEPNFLIIMIISIVFNYFAAIVIASLRKSRAERNSKIGKVVFAFTITANLALLFVYKYLNFVTATIRAFFPWSAGICKQTNFVLPIGISFFTFQAISYIIDVYRGEQEQRNLFYVGLYISLFPQLIAGPIVRYTTIKEQMEGRKLRFDLFADGVFRFLLGFNKKMLLANTLAQVADMAWNMPERSVFTSWLGALCYSLQIFFDFCGYSDMAIGLGQMLGFRFPENFNYPYISRTITEFWRRWHISLGSWFRDYLYIPLGGSRVTSKKRLIINLMIVWTATGIWHGASWNFILWGVMYGVLLIIEKIFILPRRKKESDKGATFYQIFTLIAVMIGWVLFRSEGLTTAVSYLKSMFCFAGNKLVDATGLFYLREYVVFLIAGCLCSTPVFRVMKQKISMKGEIWESVSNLTSCITQFILFLVSVSFLIINAHNPFIYFNF